MTNIHPTAIIGKNVELGSNVVVGAYAVIEDNVIIGDNSKIFNHSFIGRYTSIGKENNIFQFSSIGEIPQDKKFKHNDVTYLIIGDNNTIREHVTINRGTLCDLGKTTIGNDNWIMATVHIAHDCIIGNNNVIANYTAFAGHVVVGDNVVFGGNTLVHQFCHIGDYGMFGINTVIKNDTLPYTLYDGTPAIPRVINKIGLVRADFSKAQIKLINICFKLILKIN